METIAEKAERRDFAFFLDHGNFFKVVDTLEKFQEGFVNNQSQAGRDFIVFKRQLYQMYEVKNRSVYEHEQFSFSVERRNLKWLWDANNDYVQEIARVNHIDQQADTASLNGKVFKMKMMTPSRLRGVLSFGAAAAVYSHWLPVTMALGATVPSLGVAAAAVYGMSQFKENNVISAIESAVDGHLKITIQKSPLVSTTITCAIRDVRSICALGDDDMGADDVNGNIVHVAQYADSNGDVKQDGVFTLPADAFRDKQYLEWILAPKSAHEETADDFSDLMEQRFQERAQAPKMGFLSAIEARQTGFANISTDSATDQAIEDNEHQTEDNLARLTELYGKERLEQMKPAELYKLYRHHTS